MDVVEIKNQPVFSREEDSVNGKWHHVFSRVVGDCGFPAQHTRETTSGFPGQSMQNTFLLALL